MNTVLIVACSECGGYLLAKTEQKTRTCPYCGAKVNTEKAKKIASATNSYEASTLLRKLKSEAGSKRK